MQVNLDYEYNKDEQRWEIMLTFADPDKDFMKYSLTYVKPENFNPDFVLGGFKKMIIALNEEMVKTSNGN